MIERLIVTVVLLAFGVGLFAFTQRRNLRRAAALAITDPLLAGARPGVPTIIYFTTPHCQPCKTQQQPALERLQVDLGERVQIIRVDAAADPDAAARWGVFTAPTTFVLDAHGGAQAVNHGVASTEALKQQLQTVLAL